MLSLLEIAEQRANGKYGWGKFLVAHVLPMIENGQTYYMISSELERKYDMVFSEDSLSTLVRRYRAKYEIPETVTRTEHPPAEYKTVQVEQKKSYEPIVQNQDVSKNQNSNNEVRPVKKPLIDFSSVFEDDSPEAIIEREQREIEERKLKGGNLHIPLPSRNK